MRAAKFRGRQAIPRFPSASRAMWSPNSSASRTSWVTNSDGFPEIAGQRAKFTANLVPRYRIERAERFVEQEHRRIGGQRPRHAYALALPAGKFARVSDARTPRAASRRAPAVPSRARRCDLFAASRANAVPRDVVRHGEMGKQAGLLNDVADLPAQFDRVPLARWRGLPPDTSPEVGISSALTILSAVVLPDPLRPSSTSVCPAPHRRSGPGEFRARRRDTRPRRNEASAARVTQTVHAAPAQNISHPSNHFHLPFDGLHFAPRYTGDK